MRRMAALSGRVPQSSCSGMSSPSARASRTCSSGTQEIATLTDAADRQARPSLAYDSITASYLTQMQMAGPMMHLPPTHLQPFNGELTAIASEQGSAQACTTHALLADRKVRPVKAPQLGLAQRSV